MGFRFSVIIFIFVSLCFTVVLYISLPSGSQSSCNCNKGESRFIRFEDSHQIYREEIEDDHNLAILVPFRDRFEELLEFAPIINKHLNKFNKKFRIFILHQVDGLRFNRAALLNAGFLETSEEFDYVALHDVDLVPTNPTVEYVFPRLGPYHVTAPELHPRYHYPTFIGGILLISREHFRKVNGMSTQYWGWGLEDDEFYSRLKEAKLTVYRPENMSTGKTDTFRHIQRDRRRDMVQCYNQATITQSRDRRSGLSSTMYTVLTQRKLTIDEVPVTFLDIRLECMQSVTPWCNCTSSVGNSKYKSSANKLESILPKLNRKQHLTRNG